VPARTATDPAALRQPVRVVLLAGAVRWTGRVARAGQVAQAVVSDGSRTTA
jgi:hypothetical protein